MTTEMLPDGSRRLHISRKQFEAVQGALRAYSQKTKCNSVFVVDSSGMLVAHAGTLEAESVGLLATLVAGNYAASNEMARVAGEASGFRTQFLEGKLTSIYVAGVDESFLLAVTFGSHVTFGMVRVQATKTIEELKQVLSGSEDGEQVAIVAQQVQSSDFHSELASRLDAVLSKK